ncbi:MAG TPA: DUF4440 domain-containing protein [Rhodanobacteraceae bacterium]|nr:DUF4440 domain-containing protein [Rhodanobacteraceae bacterium]
MTHAFAASFIRRWRWLLLAAGVLALAACHHTPAEQQIRAAISAGARAAEATDAGALGDLLSDGFVGNEGDLDRRQMTGLLRVARLRGEHPSVIVGPVSIEPRGDRYMANFTVTLAGRDGGVLPRRLGVYKVVSAWRLEDGDWRCYNASWKRRI